MRAIAMSLGENMTGETTEKLQVNYPTDTIRPDLQDSYRDDSGYDFWGCNVVNVFMKYFMGIV